MTSDRSIEDESLLALTWLTGATALLASLSHLEHTASAGFALAATLLDAIGVALLVCALRRFGLAALRSDARAAPDAIRLRTLDRASKLVRIELGADRLRARTRLALGGITLAGLACLLTPTIGVPDPWVLTFATMATFLPAATFAALAPLVTIDVDLGQRRIASDAGVLELMPGARLRVVPRVPAGSGHALIVCEHEQRPLVSDRSLAPAQLMRVAEAIAEVMGDVEIEAPESR